MLAARTVRNFSGANEFRLHSGIGMRQERGSAEILRGRTWKQFEALSCHFTAERRRGEDGRRTSIFYRARPRHRRSATGRQTSGPGTLIVRPGYWIMFRLDGADLELGGAAASNYAAQCRLQSYLTVLPEAVGSHRSATCCRHTKAYTMSADVNMSCANEIRQLLRRTSYTRCIPHKHIISWPSTEKAA